MFSNQDVEYMWKFKKEVDEYMSLAEMYTERGREEGLEKGMRSLITVMTELHAPEHLIIQKLCTEYGITKDDAINIVKKYGK